MSMQTFSLNHLIKKKYLNGQLAVFLYDTCGQQIAELSIMEDKVELDKDEFILKDYSENGPIIDELMKKEILALTGRYVMVDNHLWPICKIID